MGVEAVTFNTFIIPTMGRTTLDRAVKSVIAQYDWNWKAIVIFDERYPVNYETDNSHVYITKASVGGHAGLVRNQAIDMVDTDWMAFLDDDDYIEPNYLDRLKFHINQDPTLDIVIFSYKDETNGNVQPRPGINDILECKVGISFAIKTSFVRNNSIKFTSNAIEDFRFLNDSKKAGANYKITHEILYRVGGIGGWLPR